MEIQVTSSPQATIVAVSGDLDSASAPELERTLADLLDKRKNRLVLDLSGVRYIDSAGLGELIRAMKRAREAGGDVRMCGLRGDVLRIFEMTQLIEGMAVYRTLSDAISSWQ